MLSAHPADPTLTTDNLMEVVKEVEHQWEDLGRKLGLRTRAGKVQTQLSSVRGMADVVDEYVRRSPTPCWKIVATALQRMKLDKLADEVTTKYVRGRDVTWLILKLNLVLYNCREAEGGLKFGEHACRLLTLTSIWPAL